MNQPNQHLISHLLFTNKCFRYSHGQCQEFAFLKMYLDLPKSLLWARQIPALSRTSISRQSYPAILSLMGRSITLHSPHTSSQKSEGGFSLCHIKGFTDSVDHCFLCIFCRLSSSPASPWWTYRYRLYPFSGWFSLACAALHWPPPAGQAPLSPPHPHSTSQLTLHAPSRGGWWFILHNHKIGDFGCTRAQETNRAPTTAKSHISFLWMRSVSTSGAYGKYFFSSQADEGLAKFWYQKDEKLKIEKRSCKDRWLWISLFLVWLLNY